MHRLVLGVILAAALAAGSGVHAAGSDAAVRAGYTPADGVMYRADLFFEDVVQWMLGISPSRKLAYIKSRILEREQEAREMMDAKGVVSDETFVALGKRMDLRLDAAEIVRRGGDKDALREIEHAGHVADLEYLDRFLKEKDVAAKRREELRAEIAEARKAGNQNRVADLVGELDKAVERWNDLDRRYVMFDRVSELAAERAEDLMDPAVQAEMAAGRATELSARAAETWARLLATLGVQKQDGEVTAGRLQELLTDKGKTAQDLQKAMRDADVAVRKAAIKREAAKDDAVRNEPEPQKAPAPKKPAPAAQPATPPKPRLPKVPSESAADTKPVLAGGRVFAAQVGTAFRHQFSAELGLPPYHYQLDTAGGFPPFGLVLSPSGSLSGTPTAQGTRSFRVCVVDTAGNFDCPTVTVVVADAPAPPAPPPPPPVAASISLSGTQCAGMHILVSGRASGPVGATIGSHYSDSVQCGGWSKTSSGGCRRDDGQPESVTWTYEFYHGAVSDDPQVIYVWTRDSGEKSIHYEKNCP